jgi:heptaprenyl diphosphate synthase
MAAVVCGMSLPTIIAAQDFPGTLLPDMIREFSSAWTVSNDGQIRDLQTVPEEANCRRVLTTYRHKTGAAYGAVSAMAARLGGCIDMRSTLWRRFGETLGCVGQFRNDQEDFVSGRDEDLKNGTATFLLYCLLDSLGESGRRHHLGLLRHARTSAVAREEVKQAMLTPDVIGVYFGHVDALRVEALGLLDALDADGANGHRLRELVEQAATPVPLFAAAALNGAGPGQLGVRLAPRG